MPSREERLEEIARLAVQMEARTGLPAQLTVAQWAVESEWGAKPVGQANYFGMKKANRHEKCATQITHEVEGGKRVLKTCKFADYNSLEESTNDYAQLITAGYPYRDAWSKYKTSGSLGQLIQGVTNVYAGDKYAPLAYQIANQRNVTQAIAKARQETGK